MGAIWFWIEPTGEVHQLTDNPDVNMLVGLRGAWAPPADLVTDAVPLQAGAVVRGVRTRPRELDLSLFVQAADEAELRLRLREMARWFDPRRGDGRLRIVPPTGFARELVCRAPRGFPAEEDFGRTWWNVAAEVPLTFYAADPYWVAAAPVASTYALAVPPTWFPWPPVTLGETTIAATPTETNPGDVAAAPIWTIAGPSSGVTLTNLTTGEALTLNRTLYAGDTVVVDARFGVRTVTMLATGETLYPDLAPGSSLWWLEPGDNLITVDMRDASTASSIALTYFPKFRTV